MHTPRTVGSGRKPGNLYASERRFGFDEVGIGKSCQICAPRESLETLYSCAFQTSRPSIFTDTNPRRAKIKMLGL